MGRCIAPTQPHDNCGSSDARFVYEDEEGKVYWKCYSCGTGGQGEGGDMESVEVITSSNLESKPTKDKGNARALTERDLDADTLKSYGVTATAEQTFFPYTDLDGTVTGYKVRHRTVKEKMFVEGKLSPLFGWQKFNKGGKYITITEGEYDALAAFFMTGSKWPVVSIPTGAAGALKACRQAYEYLDSFENIVISFDADEAGKKAAQQVAELFGSKAKVVKLSKYKDANEYLSQQASREYVDAWWRAEQYTPDGILAGHTLWERLNVPPKQADCMYPFEDLNGLTFGIRKGELVMVAAGSGLGKSQFIREIIYKMLMTTEDTIGAMFLEESVEKTGKSIMSLACNKPLHLPDTEVTEEELKDAFDRTLGLGRLYFFDHFGSSSIDNIVNRVKYMARGLGCGFVFLDHVSIIVSSQEYGDERKALDEIMTKLRTVVQETGIGLICVSHLRRPDGKGHEEGAATSLNQLRGSASIAQLSDIVIGLERDGQNDDPVERNTTHMRVLKNRFSGITGPAGSAVYSTITGRMGDISTAEAL